MEPLLGKECCRVRCLTPACPEVGVAYDTLWPLPPTGVVCRSCGATTA